jgi:hypothetical protein
MKRRYEPPRQRLPESEQLTPDEIFKMLSDRPKWESHPNKECEFRVAQLANYAVAKGNIAKSVGISDDVMLRYYAYIVDLIKDTKLHARCMHAWYKGMDRGNAALILGFADRVLGMKPHTVQEHKFGENAENMTVDQLADDLASILEAHPDIMGKLGERIAAKAREGGGDCAGAEAPELPVQSTRILN